MARRKKGRKVHGILLLDKPLGISSNRALQDVKYLYKAQKAGHTGSLDPLASGLLPLCFGEATKLSAYLLDADKRYQVKIKCGTTTTTADSEGEILETYPTEQITQTLIEKIIPQFIGQQEQIPPMYSALKHEGQRLYKLARQGIEVERKKRKINIKSIDLLSCNLPFFELDVLCTKGTYIRTLAEDIGKALGSGAHVSELRRTAVGNFKSTNLISIDTLKKTAEQGQEALDELLLPIDCAVDNWQSVTLNADSSYYLRQGQSIMVSNPPSDDLFRIYAESGEFLGIGHLDRDGKVAPKRLMMY